MAQWDWLTKPAQPYNWRFFRNVLVKGLILFAIINIAYALINPLPLLGKLSLYNVLWPGRLRLPFGENPDESYNLSLNNLDAMLASHIIAGTPKAADEYRVIVIGDSSVWGVLLKPEETLAGNLDAAQYRTATGKRVRVYNLGYPIKSLAKDVLILAYAMRYQPDLIIWPITLESFAPSQQLNPLLVRENPAPMRTLIQKYQMLVHRYPPTIKTNDPQFDDPSFWNRTIIGQRRQLADLLRLQLYGAMWKTTGIDQVYPRFYEPHRENFDTDVTWQGLQSSALTKDQLAFDVLDTGISVVAGHVPVLLVNEPIFISSGVNSDLRYNTFYPRWAYDSYRDVLTQESDTNNWNLLDLWNAIPSDQFTDSAVHLMPSGSRQLADVVGTAMMQLIDGPRANIS